MIRRRWILLLLIGLPIGAAFAGCAPFVLVGGKLSLSEYGFEVTVPEGWHRAMRVEDMLLITRDGMPLQQIRIERLPMDKELKFTKRKFDDRMPPHDVAEVEVDEHRSDPGVLNFALEENVPTGVAGSRGFRLVYTWKTKEGLRLKRIHYGFREGKWVYRLMYQAAARYYFDLDLSTFDRVLESFRLLEKTA